MSREDSTIVPPAQVPDEDLNPSHNSPENQQKPKRKRNRPGNPDPRAKVIALSPRELLEEVDYTCQLCRSVLQTMPALEFHVLRHNIPRELQQSDHNDLKPVYICPEPTCAHHDPHRALSHINVIKKHYRRMHCERKWRCENCGKIYAVEGDLKKHSKKCSTYRCEYDCPFPRWEYDAHVRPYHSRTTREEMRSSNLEIGTASNNNKPCQQSMDLWSRFSQVNTSSNHSLDMEASTGGDPLPPIMSAVESLGPPYSTYQTYQADTISGANLISATGLQHEKVGTGAATSHTSTSSSFFGGLLGSMDGQQQSVFQSFARGTPICSSPSSYFYQAINFPEQSQENGLRYFGSWSQFVEQDPVVSSSSPFEIPNMEEDHVAATSIGLPAPTKCQGRRMAPPISSGGKVLNDHRGLMSVPFSGLEVQPVASPPVLSPWHAAFAEIERLLMED